MNWIEIERLLPFIEALPRDLALWGQPDVLKRHPKHLQQLLWRVAEFQKRLAKNGEDSASLGYCFRDFMHTWKSSGRNVFRLYEGVAHSLLLTEPASEHKLPFSSFVMEIPKHIVNIGPTTISEIQVSLLKPVLVSHDHVALPPGFYHAAPGASLEELLFIRAIGGLGTSWFNHSFQISMSDLSHTHPTHTEAQCAPTNTAGIFDPTVATKTIAAIRLLVANFVSFITAAPDHIVLCDPRGVSRAERDGLIVTRIYDVAKHVRINKQRAAVACAVARGECGPQWKLKYRYQVMGHFRWQPIGARLLVGEYGPSNAKRIWIEPHWKGPTGVDVLQHIYTVAA